MKLRAGTTAAILAATTGTLATGSAEFAAGKDYSRMPHVEWSLQWREREFIRPRQDTRLLSMLTRRIAGQTDAGPGLTIAHDRRGQLTPWKGQGRGD